MQMSRARELERIARALSGAANASSVLSERPVATELTFKEALSISVACAREMGGEVAAWKLGSTTYASRTALNVPPFFGAIGCEQIFDSGTHIRQTDVLQPQAEPEIVLRLGRDFPPAGREYSVSEVREGIDAILPGLEIPALRIRDALGFGATWLVADNGAAGGLVLGSMVEMDDAMLAELKSVPVYLNGDCVGVGRSTALVEGPIETLTRFVNLASSLGIDLLEGQVVATGGLRSLQKCNVGDRIVADFGSLGVVEARF